MHERTADFVDDPRHTRSAPESKSMPLQFDISGGDGDANDDSDFLDQSDVEPYGKSHDNDEMTIDRAQENIGDMIVHIPQETTSSEMIEQIARVPPPVARQPPTKPASLVEFQKILEESYTELRNDVTRDMRRLSEGGVWSSEVFPGS